MNEPIKRMRYFDRQFLRKRDFEEEQQYHLNSRRRYNRLLLNPGIAEGLQVEQQGPQLVKVKPGAAYDPDGHEIVLMTDAAVNLSDKEKDPDGSYATPVFVSILYAEQPCDPSEDAPVRGEPTRILEAPELKVLRERPMGGALLLAGIERDRITGNISTIDASGRRSAGTSVGDDITARRVTLKKEGVEPGLYPELGCEGPKQAYLRGALSVGSMVVAGNLDVQGKVDGRDVSVDGTKVDTLAAGPTSDASNLHYHATIPIQTRRYHVPLVPISFVGRPAFQIPPVLPLGPGSAIVMQAPKQTNSEGVLPLYLPECARLTRMSITYRKAGEDSNPKVTMTLFQSTSPVQPIGKVTIDTEGTKEFALNHPVNNAAGAYFIAVKVDQYTDIEPFSITKIAIDYEITRLF